MRRIVNSYLYLFLCLLFHLATNAQPRSVVKFNQGWKFFLGNDNSAIDPGFDDSHWRQLSLPHDWSIESDFKKDAPATTQGGALPGGIGWYRKTFILPVSAKGKNVFIEFDGIYKNSEVWINGHYLGKRPNGYVSFSYDLTPYLHPSTKRNVIAVKVDNSQQPDSRWYSGSGIYRNVRLLVIEPAAFVESRHTFITASFIDTKSAALNIKAGIRISPSTNVDSIKFSLRVYDASNKLVYSARELGWDHMGFKKPARNFEHTIKLNDPQFWSPANPVLYKVIIKVKNGTKLVDEFVSDIGIRSFYIDEKQGFFINNQPLKIRGVCMHHDLGALGSAFNISAAKRQLRILKEMGCNAIRFSHNPPAADILDLCDQMGFLVIDEAFDMWQKRKNKFDYHLDFKEWHEADLEAMVLRDRNHPSVIMWSIGNEIREQFDSTGITITKELVSIIKNLDPTRPVTSALTETFPEKNFITKANALDVLGFNYKDYDYTDLPKRFPGQKFIALETASALETRGVYQFPSDSMRIWPPDYKVQDSFTGNKDLTCAAYDNTFAYWGNSHERSWLAVKNNLHMAGGFVWSGFDYLGEPVPYPKFPARSSYYGIIDLAGFPKDVYYMYQSEWTTRPVLHIFPHWNWKPGQVVDVWAYYNNADEVELFLNGRTLGSRRKSDSALHVVWRVPFEAGTLKAVSKKNGKIVLEKELRTAGPPTHIELIADKNMLKANSDELSFIKARIVDKDGNLVPDANNLISFSVSSGMIAGTDNGYQADTVSLKSNKRNAWKGMALAIIRSSEKKGNITLKATSPGLSPATITLRIN